MGHGRQVAGWEPDYRGKDDAEDDCTTEYDARGPKRLNTVSLATWWWEQCSPPQQFRTPVVVIAPDGKHFAIIPMPQAAAEKGSVHITFLFNYFDELRRRMPTGK